ncbi:MAG: SdrD B-like domain-containing protein, partial [Saprospiraceae bacterium]
MKIFTLNRTDDGPRSVHWKKPLGMARCFLLMVFVFCMTGWVQAMEDVSVTQMTSNTQARIDDVVTLTITVANDGTTDVTGLQITNAIPVGTMYSTHNAPAGTTYDQGTGIWNIGSALDQTTALLTLTIDVSILQEGIIFSRAEVTAMTETDTDSTPNNGRNTEDDFAEACVSVPIPFCPTLEDTITLMAPQGLTSYQWFLDTGSGATAIVGANTDSLDAVEAGIYTVTADNNMCPSGECCPMILEEYCPSSLGDFVFYDLNQDGIQDLNEMGVENVKIYLQTAVGVILDSVLTDNTGFYEF